MEDVGSGGGTDLVPGKGFWSSPTASLSATFSDPSSALCSCGACGFLHGPAAPQLPHL